MSDDFSELETAELSLWTRLIEHLRQSQRGQHAIKLMLILGGGFAAGLAQLPLPIADTAKAIIGVTGVTMVLAGGALLLLIEKDYFELIDDARGMAASWRRASVARGALEVKKAQLESTLKCEQDLMIAFDTIIRFLEKALALAGVGGEERLNIFVRSAAPRLVAPMSLGRDGDWTISVFLRKAVDGEQRMCRVASCWMDGFSAEEDKRTWARGKGWTGMAWLYGEERSPTSPSAHVVEWDTAIQDAKDRYDTDDQEREEDYERFRSVAAIPFRVRGSPEVAGVVTTTSASVGTFGRVEGTPARRNFDTIKSFTLLVAALAAAGET